MTSRRQNTACITFCLWSICLDIFANIFHVCKANTSTDKSVFSKLQFLALTYDKGVLSCDFDVV